MADYYPLISRAVAGLDKNAGELRRSLYERARTALVDQLRGVTPPLGESEITRERLALEEAIRKVEMEEARRIRQEAPRAGERRATQPPDSIEPEEVPSAPPDPAPLQQSEMPAAPASDLVAAPASSTPSEEFSAGALGPMAAPVQARRPARKRPPEPGIASPGDINKVAGDADTDADALSDPALQAAEEARKAYLAASPATSELDRMEAEDRRSAGRRRSPILPGAPRTDAATALEPEASADASPYSNFSGTRTLERPQLPDSVRFAAARGRRAMDDEEDGEPLSRRLLSGFVRIAIGIVLVLIVGATAYWQRHNLLSAVKNVASLVHAPSAQPPVDTTPQRTKIPDRIGQQEAVPGAGATTTPTAPQGQVEAPVAQRVVLYEEDPNDSAGKQYVGTVVWRTEMVSPGPGQTPDIAVRGDITIPERNMSVTWSLRRNTDKDLPASHTVSIMFTLPADFSHGGISEIRGVLMKQTEQTRGVSLAGLSVKVTTGFFLVGLSAADADLQRNIQLLKDRTWFDIAIVYTDGRRAILAVEKGTPGERAFAQAFAGWGQ